MLRRFQSLLQRRLRNQSAPNPYEGLRHMMLSLDAKTIPNTLEIPDPVRAIVTDFGQTRGTATLVVLADGTVSLYYSGGGGLLGLGPKPGAAKAAKDFLTAGKSFLSHARPAQSQDLPPALQTRFYFLTLNGMLYYDAPENDLGNNRLPVSPLFHLAQQLITIARIISEQVQKGK